MYTMFSSFPLFFSSSLCSHTDRQSYASLIFNKSKMQLSTALRKCSENSQSSRSNKRQQRVDTLRFRTPVMKGGRASNPRWEANSASCLEHPLDQLACRVSPKDLPEDWASHWGSLCCTARVNQKRGQAVSEPAVTCKLRSSSWRAEALLNMGSIREPPERSLAEGRMEWGHRCCFSL